MEYDREKWTTILITKETKAMLKDYMDEYKIYNTLDISYHKAIKALLAEHYKNIDNLFVEQNQPQVIKEQEGFNPYDNLNNQYKNNENN